MTAPAGERARRVDWLMICLRYVLPAAIVSGGVIVMAFGSETDLEGGAGIVSAGLATYGMNWLYRASIDGDRVREEEEAARTYLDLHGHWPDEAPAARVAAAKSGAASVPGAHSMSGPHSAPGAHPVHVPESHAGPARDLHRGSRLQSYGVQRRRDHR